MSNTQADLVTTTQEHIEYVAQNMRAEDRAEVMASNGLYPLPALNKSLEISAWKVTLLIDEEILGIIGLVATDDPLLGIPWMLGTDNIKKRSKSFMRVMPTVVQVMKSFTPTLTNYVHAENKPAIRYLTQAGFNLQKEPDPMGIDGALFYKFTMGIH
jgi:hypothetical protein